MELTSAFSSSKNLTASVMPCRAAMWSGVLCSFKKKKKNVANVVNYIYFYVNYKIHKNKNSIEQIYM